MWGFAVSLQSWLLEEPNLPTFTGTPLYLKSEILQEGGRKGIRGPALCPISNERKWSEWYDFTDSDTWRCPFSKTKNKQNHLQFKECWIPKSQRHARTMSQKASENMSYQDIIEKPEMAAIREYWGQQVSIHHPSLQANYSSQDVSG